MPFSHELQAVVSVPEVFESQLIKLDVEAFEVLVLVLLRSPHLKLAQVEQPHLVSEREQDDRCCTLHVDRQHVTCHLRARCLHLLGRRILNRLNLVPSRALQLVVRHLQVRKLLQPHQSVGA